MLTLYLPTRDLVSCNGKVDPLLGVLHVDKDFVKGQRIFGQLTLTFRWVSLIGIDLSSFSASFMVDGRDREKIDFLTNPSSHLVFRVNFVVATDERTRR